MVPRTVSPVQPGAEDSVTGAAPGGPTATHTLPQDTRSHLLAKPNEKEIHLGFG